MSAEPWPWPDSMDAMIAAPTSHRVLLENDHVRVLEVTIEPGRHEPEHTHRAASVMIVDEPARIIYHAPGAEPLEFGQQLGTKSGPRVQWMEPEGPHSVENTDQHRYHAIRIELK
jgi:predicted metal-dependent enzyme (double-stranded beta helix superfamily)